MYVNILTTSVQHDWEAVICWLMIRLYYDATAEHDNRDPAVHQEPTVSCSMVTTTGDHLLLLFSSSIH